MASTNMSPAVPISNQSKFPVTISRRDMVSALAASRSNAAYPEKRSSSAIEKAESRCLGFSSRVLSALALSVAGISERVLINHGHLETVSDYGINPGQVDGGACWWVKSPQRMLQSLADIHPRMP